MATAFTWNKYIGDGVCTVEAIDVFTTAGWRGTLNVSQNIDRMANGSEECVPCVTPSAVLWNMKAQRALTGRALRFLHQCWNIEFQLKIVQHASVQPGRHGKACVSRFPSSPLTTWTYGGKGLSDGWVAVFGYHGWKVFQQSKHSFS